MPLADVTEEAKRILAAARRRKITLKLLGGVGIFFSCPSAPVVNPNRKYLDIDFMGHANKSREIGMMFVDLGYSPRVRFNALHGSRRLVFNDLEHKRRVDIFLDIFEMSHKFNFRRRMEMAGDALPLADLLATKIQVFKTSEKDLKDVVTLFVDHDVGMNDSVIIGAYLSTLVAKDWGAYKTFTINIEKTVVALNSTPIDPTLKELARSRIAKLRKMMEDAPKSMKWRLRAQVGERAKWYELPEADQETIDSPC